MAIDMSDDPPPSDVSETASPTTREGAPFAHFFLAFCMLTAEVLWIAFLIWITARAL